MIYCIQNCFLRESGDNLKLESPSPISLLALFSLSWISICHLSDIIISIFTVNAWRTCTWFRRTRRKLVTIFSLIYLLLLDSTQSVLYCCLSDIWFCLDSEPNIFMVDLICFNFLWLASEPTMVLFYWYLSCIFPYLNVVCYLWLHILACHRDFAFCWYASQVVMVIIDFSTTFSLGPTSTPRKFQKATSRRPRPRRQEVH